MKEIEKQTEVTAENEEVVSDEALLQFIEDSNEVNYFSEYSQLYLSNY